MYFNANCSSRLSIVVLVISPLIPEPCVAFGGAKLGVIEGVEGFRAEIKMVPFEGQGPGTRSCCRCPAHPQPG
jgi:hypothetical protein